MKRKLVSLVLATAMATSMMAMPVLAADAATEEKADGVDLLIINPVNSSSAESITDKGVAADIPLVYVNREPSADEEQRWADNDWNVTYVGCDARQSGTMQGEIRSLLILVLTQSTKTEKLITS